MKRTSQHYDGALPPKAAARRAGLEQDPDRVAPPPAWCTLELLARAVRQAATEVTVPCPLGGPPLRWGAQLDLRPIPARLGERSAGQVAGYLAKYATKATEGLGAALDQPIRAAADLERLELPEHARRLVRACWALGGRRELAPLRLRRWAHMLGFGGHCTTKSRRYSVSFAALRAARRAWSAHRRHGPTVPLDPHGRLLPPPGFIVDAGWQYAGRGYTTPADAWLAASMAAQARDARRLAREELNRVA